jgi:SAM-dependent methyltransferase
MKTASTYHQSRDFHLDFRQSRLRKCAAIIGGLTPGTMLDIGCANGDWCRYWADRGWTCSGIDINPGSIEEASQAGVDARLCDLSDGGLPFDDASFDLVFAGEIIEHLVDTDGFVSEVHRCLKPGGHLLLTTPNLASFENRLRLLLGFYPMWLNWNLGGAGHVRAYTPRILKHQLRQCGFSIVKHTGNWVPFIPQKFTDDIKCPGLAFTGTLMPGLAMDIIILARKNA